MKYTQTYITRKLKSVILLLGIIGFSGTAFSQQMSGTVYIDQNGVASTTVFKNWYSFWRSLQGLARTDGGPNFAVTPFGVSGNLTVEVLNSNTTAEATAISFPNTIGSSINKKITINGNGNTLLYSGTNAAIQLTGADNITFNNLIVQSNSSSGAGFWFNNQSDSNTLNGCSVFLSNSISTVSNHYYIAFSTAVTSPTSYATVATGTTGQPGSYNTINNCKFYTQTGGTGPYYAVSLNGNSSSYTSVAQNNTFTNNTISNFYYYGVYMYYVNGNVIDNNDISRSNATGNATTSMYGIFSYYHYGTSRKASVSGNTIHDLPFAGASLATTTLSSYNLFYVQYPTGNATFPFQYNGNTVKNIYGTTSTQYVHNIYYPVAIDVTNNSVDNIQSSGTTASNYIFYIYYPTGVRCNYNSITNVVNNYYLYNYYIYYNAHGVFGWNEFIGNKSINNQTVNYMYNAYIYYYTNLTGNNWKFNNNYFANNRVTGSTGYFYNYCYYFTNLEFNNNVFVNNTANSHYYYLYSAQSGGGVNAEIRNNTIQCDMSNVPSPASSYLYLYHYLYYHTVSMTGNIWDLKGPTSTTNYYRYVYMYLSYSNPAGLKEFNRNTYYARGNYTYPYWYFNGSDYANPTNFLGAGVTGPNDNQLDPKWVNQAGLDYRPGAWWTQNNVPYTAFTAKDGLFVNRNKVNHDRGGLETNTDIQAVSTNFTVPSTVCAGYSTGATNMVVKSNYAYDQATGFNVSYSVNNGPKISATVTKKMNLGDTAMVWFPQPLTLSKVGLNRIALFIDLPDDNNSNDSFIFTTTVKPAPGGGKFTFSPKPTATFYQYTKSNDVTVLKAPVIYNSVAPRVYNNTGYGTNWTASVFAITKGGNMRPGSEIALTPPTGSSDLEVAFNTTDASMEDSTIWVCLKVTDLNNGCDTIIKRQVLIYPTVVTSFSFPATICDGDQVQFENKSKVRSGSMEFFWNFGTGNPADISESPEPTFTFPGSGTYKIKLLAKTLPYGFASYDSAIVVVKQKPIASFTHNNACEGYNLTFDNSKTTTGAALNWNFGDNTSSNASNPNKKYVATGSYTVTLKATLNGCSDIKSKRVYQFPKPKASWTKVSGNCDNEAFTFNNASTIATGNVGSYWDFNDGTISADFSPSHTFTSSGDKMVKLIAVSAFGCKDSLTSKVTVNESPKINFNYDKACSLSPTQFTNTTPTVAGAGGNVKDYRWTFSEGGTTTFENPSVNWITVGPKTINFKMELMNGCKADITKYITVGVEPLANFSAPDVCEGKSVVFQNKTTWAEGNISYVWNFGDGNTSTEPNPIHTFSKAFSPNVTLFAKIAGGCSDSVVIPVNVLEQPKTCAFSATPNYASSFYGIKLQSLDNNGNPLAQNGVTYTWVIQGQGNRTGSTVNHDLKKDGVYEITMNAVIDATGCNCSKTMTVYMDRASSNKIDNSGIALFPNPNNGQFNLSVNSSFGKNLNIVITSMSGAVVKQINTENNGLISVNSGNLADGVYSVRVSSGENTAVRRNTISK